MMLALSKGNSYPLKYYSKRRKYQGYFGETGTGEFDAGCGTKLVMMCNATEPPRSKLRGINGRMLFILSLDGRGLR